MMKCLRCGSPMYGIKNPDGSRTGTCSSCCQHVDVARCSNEKCGDQKCLHCYNKTFLPKSPAKPSASSPIIPHDEDF